MLLPLLTLLLVSQISFAQQTKKSEAIGNNEEMKERKIAKEAAHLTPTKTDDRLLEKKVYKKERVKRKGQSPEKHKATPHKDGRYPQKSDNKKQGKFSKKGLKIHNKAQKQAVGTPTQKQ